MPKWGLTPSQLETEPWGLPKSELQPAKSITDPVHGDIYVNRLEQRLIDSPPLQRLRRVRQLGTTHLVYPGATHTRFSHALGALRAAQDLLDAALQQRYGAHPESDLFAEWESEEPTNYDLRIAEATVLTRLGALLHDMCHVPYGHSIEDDIGILLPHDDNIERFELLWSKFDQVILRLLEPRLKAALQPLILSKAKEIGSETSESMTRYPFVQDIVGNTICADLMDYLQRDHLFTGLPSQLGHRFIDGFYVSPSSERHLEYRNKMVIRISKGKRERADIVSELFKYLRYRYELSERALVHHAKLAADAMIGKLLEIWRDALWIEQAEQDGAKFQAAERADFDRAKEVAAKISEHFVANVDKKVRTEMEKFFLRYGDDGLLEQILDRAGTLSEKDRRWNAIHNLAAAVQNRYLYKPIARFWKRTNAAKLYSTFGNPEERRRLEEGAAKFAGLKHRWHILLWIPKPDMRLKAAEVLVNMDGEISPLREHDRGEHQRGVEIYQSHEQLWAIYAFAPNFVREDRIRMNVALAWLATQMKISWEDPTDIPSTEQLAVELVAEELDLKQTIKTQLLEDAASVAARGVETDTFDGIVETVKRRAQDLMSEEGMQGDLL